MDNTRAYDALIRELAAYVHLPPSFTEEAYQTARLCFADAVGCAALSLHYPACTALLGPVVPGTMVPFGSRVPCTSYVLDPIQAAFNFGTMIRWLDFNDTWLAAEWGHPSDNIGGIFPVMDYQCRQGKIFSGKQLLEAIIQAYEIQGILALKNSLNKVGLDHVLFVKIATAAVVSKLLGGSVDQTQMAISQVFADGGALRTYRHAPNTGSRKSWAAGDATARGVFLAHLTLKGEMGYPSVLSTPKWGFEDVLMQKEPLVIERPLENYVMENILFKVSYPAEFHAQTAVECAVFYSSQVRDRLSDIVQIEIETHESAIRIIDKKGPLYNPADRDHCLQYMVAVALIKGGLTAEDYEEKNALDSRIDELRNKIVIKENPDFTKDYLDPDKRSIANRLTIYFRNGVALGPKTIEYPLGHRRRRKEGIPLLIKKLKINLQTQFSSKKLEEVMSLFQNHEKFLEMRVDHICEHLI